MAKAPSRDWDVRGSNPALCTSCAARVDRGKISKNSGPGPRPAHWCAAPGVGIPGSPSRGLVPRGGGLAAAEGVDRGFARWIPTCRGTRNVPRGTPEDSRPPPQPRGIQAPHPPAIGGSRRVHRRPDRGCDTGGRTARERDTAPATAPATREAYTKHPISRVGAEPQGTVVPPPLVLGWGWIP